MRSPKWLIGLILGAVLSALSYGVYAQSVTQQTLTGNECWNAGQGPGGPSSFICANLVRNSWANARWTAITTSFVVSQTITDQALSDGGVEIFAAQPSTTGTIITLPPNPFPDGGQVRFCNGTNTNFVTNVISVVANTGQTMVTTGAASTLTTLAAQTCAGWIFNLPTTSWYKVQ